MMKKLWCVLLVLMLVFVTLSCGPQGGSPAAGAAAANNLQRIIDSGVLRAGLSLNGPPIGGRDNKGEPYGYDVDFAQKMAETLGVKLEVIDVDGSTRIAALTSGRIDVAFANMTGTLERAKTIDFSIPYLKSGIKMMVRTGTAFKDVEDLNMPSVKIGVGRGTTGEELALKFAPKAEIVYVSDFTDQILLLRQSKVDAVFEDSTLIDFTAGQSNGTLTAPPRMYSSDPICIGLPKGDMEFVRWVDMFVSWMISSGWQAETYEKWWGTPPSANLTVIW
ncbi:transporter substrate-binding domain-containing protein [Breznakiella homolactica]|uniref:Transporter substrate-binding domain-containing protein n=1 Tax=Breznakiella homolactica TaxID=2798577 RepID=A0A7T8BDC0_9SPIR|nr:transporter substrate-binding domain-containing protein [Breznakiella homolactica]QQO11088.1 transporter substrate-binding domain-containing protein [Breznakiella homolactica]